MKNNRALKLIIFLLPLICGTAGFVSAGERLLDSMFFCVQMYVLNYPYIPPNALAEIARWTAPFVSAYSVLMIASTVRERLKDMIRSRRPDSVAVYGPEELRAPLLAALGKRGVAGGTAPSRAAGHILLWDEEENLRFLERNRDALAGEDVYLKSSSLPAQAAAGAQLHIFCPEETAARLYWKERCLYEDSLARGHRMSVVIIGFGRLGSGLLSFGLQNNIFSPEQRIEYHVFGGDPSYLKIHHELNGLRDAVIFHGEPWEDSLPLLEEAGRVIVLQQEGQTELLSRMLLALKARRIDVFSAGEAGLGILGGDRINCFPWTEAAFRPENILSEELYRRAKALNLRYAHLYQGVQETEEALDAEWEKLDTFTRYSNISSADYHEVRLRMLEAMGEPADAGAISPGRMELLAELEHMRWCRYHLLNNWSYGVPEGGKNKDAARRVHRDLKPYAQLSEAEKQKDRDAVRVMLEL